MTTKTTKNKPVIAFSATVERVQTMQDGAIRIILDLPEDAIAQAAALMACKREGIPLRVEVKADTGGAV